MILCVVACALLVSVSPLRLVDVCWMARRGTSTRQRTGLAVAKRRGDSRARIGVPGGGEWA
jgi:hypothetical protein